MLSQICASKPATAGTILQALVVDDCKDNAMFAMGSLQLLNFECIVTHNGKSAVQMAIAKLPDVILLDVVMPEMNGIAVVQTLKQNPLTKNIPIVAVTGLAYKSQQQQIMQAGFDDYLCKPYLIDELSATLERFFDLEAIWV